MTVDTEYYIEDINLLNGEYIAAKQINPDNYSDYSPLNISATFATSTLAFTNWRYSYGMNGNMWDNAITENFKGMTLVKPLNAFEQHAYHSVNGNSANLMLVDRRSDNSPYVSENYNVYKKSWAHGDIFTQSNTNQRPIIKYPWNIGALYAQATFLEYYINPNSAGGENWYYAQQVVVTGYKNIANFLAKFGQYADTSSHRRVAAFIIRLTGNYSRNSNKNSNSLNIGFVGFDERTFPIASVEQYSYDAVAFEYAEEKTQYNYCTLGGQNYILLYEGINWTQNQNQMTMGNSVFNGGALVPCCFRDEEELIPNTFEQLTVEGAYFTRFRGYCFGVDCETLTAGDIVAPVASLGLPLIDYDSSTYTDSRFTTDGYLPISDDEGIFHGDFEKYTDLQAIPDNLKTEQQIKALTNYASGDGNFPFVNGNQNPEIKPDTNDKITETGIDETQLSTVSVFNTTYAMTNSQIVDFRNYLWNSDENIFNRIIDNAKYYNKPMDAVVNLMLFPFDVRKQISGGGTAQNIVFGRTELEGVQGVAIPDNVKTIIDLGFANLTQKFNDFRDYAPYTTAQLYVPYCQPVKLDMSVYMGHKIGVKMVVDYTTGDATGVIYRDGVAVDYTNGKIGVNISMSGADTSRKDAKFINDSLGAISSIAGKDAIGAVTNIFDAVQNFGDIDIMRRGSHSSGVATHLPQYCYILVERSNVDIISGYGDSIGYACNDYNDLASLSGFAVVENPNLTGITATEQEKTEILNLLQSGIFY